MGKLGIGYVHTPELGIASDGPQELNTQADYDRLFDSYERHELKQNGKALEDLFDICLRDKRVAITCFEANVCTCHRGRVAKAMSADRGQLKFRRGQLEFPGHKEEEAIQVEDDLYGERSAGETAVAAGAETLCRSRGGKVWHGLEDGAEIPARSMTAREMQERHTWRTRPDPFADTWEEIRQLLLAEPELQPKTLFEHLQRTYPGHFPDGQVRTLRRRIKFWRATGLNNLVDTREFTRAYEGLLRHYRIHGQKAQAGQANENGDVEQRHYRFKNAVDQALMLRGSRDFGSLAAYQAFLQKLFKHLNAGRHDCFLEEVSRLQPLPEHRLDSMRRERVRVSPGSLVTVHRNTYSVHSRLIGELVEARVLPDTVEIWYGDRKVEELPRLRGRRKHRIDHRHIVDWLVRKPGAFEHYRYREDLFPTGWFRLAHDALREEHGPSEAQKNTCRSWPWLPSGASPWWKMSSVCLLGRRDPLNADAVAHLTEPGAPPPLTTVEVATVSLAVFDELLSAEGSAA